MSNISFERYYFVMYDSYLTSKMSKMDLSVFANTLFTYIFQITFHWHKARVETNVNDAHVTPGVLQISIATDRNMPWNNAQETLYWILSLLLPRFLHMQRFSTGATWFP